MFCDSHNDILTSILSLEEIGKYITNLGFDSDIAALTLALWTTESAVNPLDNLMCLIKTFRGYSSDILLGFAIEDAGFISEKDIEKLAVLPLNYISLTWNWNNRLAGGALGDGGITALGKKVINRCVENKIYIDTAHLNKKSFRDVVKHTESVIINSHTCAAGVCPHPRNLNDDQIKEIVLRGGFIGVAFVGDFLCENGKASSDDVIRHIDYIVNKYGPDSVGLGTDFFGTSNYPSDLKDYKSLFIIVEKLFALGYNKEAVDKITHLNYLKTFNNRR